MKPQLFKQIDMIFYHKSKNIVLPFVTMYTYL